MITIKNVDVVKALETLVNTYYKGFEPTMSCSWNTLTIKSAYEAHKWDLVGNDWVYTGPVPVSEEMTCSEWKAQQRALFG